LLELLVVIAIMALIAAMAVPALKALGKSNSQVGAARQLLDDIGRARQLAISRHTTVYMAFVPTNFWCLLSDPNIYTPATTNLMDKQLTGYTFISFGKVDDQPGQHAWHYLADWQNLPDGTFIAEAKFQYPSRIPNMPIPTWQTDYPGIDHWLIGSGWSQIYGFARYPIPFPTETSPSVMLPCLVFDNTGRLISETSDFVNYHHAYIPLAQGIVSYPHDGTTKAPIVPFPSTTLANSSDVTEIPAGNSASISYNVIDVDPLSGRARLMVHQVQ
jgi:type II secretory pathway pseudopilin PulG